ncbi:hypothetical protein BDN72DRAFT_857129 [Pluteus cervinus]|uniref:Uncharacterized protein n=1 Tax=Pluteus cervinus TaxID=181527 RepID=A0ACD3AYZ6_9AGAR|nr:hypothetical protein BDN72DRAFT_857129 [Pluteus cervinus]
MSSRNPSVRGIRIQHRRWQHGGIGAIHASLNHPFFDLLRRDPFCQQDQLSQRIQSTSRTVAVAGKSRPCLIISERKFKRLFVMGTIQGKSSLAIDKLTQEFLLPVAPTFSRGKFQLTVEPAGLDAPCWVVAIPSSLPFEHLLGYWTKDGPGDLTFQVPASNLKAFLREMKQKKFDFSKMSEDDPEYKTDLIKQFLRLVDAILLQCVPHRETVAGFAAIVGRQSQNLLQKFAFQFYKVL